MAYTYLIHHIPTNLKYYGVRYSLKAKPEDLWKTYFTSSKKVKELIDEHGKESFIVEIRKLFDNPKDAFIWEQKVLRRLKVHKNKNWINNSCGGNYYCSLYKTETHKQNISKALTGKERSKEHCENLSKAMLGKDTQNWRGENNPSIVHKGKDTHSAKNNKYFKGKTHTDETKKKMSENNIMKRDRYAASKVRWNEDKRKLHSKEMSENNHNAKTWKIIEEVTGNIFEVKNLKNWCNMMNINYTSFCRNRKREKYYSGFMIIDTL
jgi:hypothetical protein